MSEQPVSQDVQAPIASGADTSSVSPQNGSSVPETIGSWESDKRWGNHFKDHNDTYRSYREIESKLESISKENKSYKAQVDEYNQFKASQEPYSEAIKFIDFLASDQRYLPRLEQFVNEITNEIKREKYGDFPDEVIQKFQKLDQLENWRQQQERAKEISEYKSKYEQSLDEVKKLSSKYGINVDDGEFIQYLIEQKISPENVKARFLEKYYTEIEDRLRQSSQSAVVQSMQESRRHSSPSSGRVSPVSKSSRDEALLAAFRK